MHYVEALDCARGLVLDHVEKLARLDKSKGRSNAALSLAWEVEVTLAAAASDYLVSSNDIKAHIRDISGHQSYEDALISYYENLPLWD